MNRRTFYALMDHDKIHLTGPAPATSTSLYRGTAGPLADLLEDGHQRIIATESPHGLWSIRTHGASLTLYRANHPILPVLPGTVLAEALGEGRWNLARAPIIPRVHVPFPKMPRNTATLTTITEKVDGTNAQILIRAGEIEIIGSRKREITPENDNYGFAAWVREHAECIVRELGDGRHFGEWAGPLIQGNRHGLYERHFFVFEGGRPDIIPNIVRYAPLLYEGSIDEAGPAEWRDWLGRHGSLVAAAADQRAIDRRPELARGRAEGVVLQVGGQRVKYKLEERKP